jgi:hypothetical protein
MTLHRILHTATKNLRDKHMPPNEFERRRHVGIVERMDMWRKSTIKIKMI